MIRVGENMSVASGHIFVVVGVDSNQYAHFYANFA